MRAAEQIFGTLIIMVVEKAHNLTELRKDACTSA